MRTERINKGVVLAAGDGGRLGFLTSTRPKVLLPVRSRLLIHHPIEALSTAGISEVAIVIGYLGDQVRTALGDGSRFGVRLDYILNPDYLGGNAISVQKVRSWAAGEPFILCMGDHVIDPGFVSRLLQKSPIAETLCVDFAPAGHHQLAESNKVVVDSSGCIERLGKGLAYWNAIDTGVFLLTERFLAAIDQCIPKPTIDIEITDVIRFLVGRGHRFATCDATGYFWADVDDETDLAFVNA